MQSKEQISLEENSSKGSGKTSSTTLPEGLLICFESWRNTGIFHLKKYV